MRVMELHSPVTVIKRSSGRSATAAAAYRSATRIECERTGQIHDYTRKRGVEGTALLLSEHAPEWAHDRRALWNAAERREKRRDAQTAREISIAFPAEFSAAQRQEAGLRIAQHIADRYHTVVDIAWHQPSRKGDERNHHMHLLFTTRRFAHGAWEETKHRLLDDRQTGSQEITALRAAVAGQLNDIAARDQLPVYVEHLSFERRGLDREATQHMGPTATELERRGQRSDIGDTNRAIRARNAERDRLREERRVVDLSIEREKRRGRAERAPSPAPAPAPDAASSDVLTALYRETQARRRQLLQELDARFGQDERAARSEVARLHELTHATGLRRMWHAVTGQAQRAEKLMAERQGQLAEFRRQREEALQGFERERVERLDTLARHTSTREQEQRALKPELGEARMEEMSDLPLRPSEDELRDELADFHKSAALRAAERGHDIGRDR